ncbi:MAG: DUF2341 domain-containing protein [Candidatus Ratteibacteria bacterium]|nr:DUF2341 domain-containing protein [Candidatus Ratteibacteria bacterium]
MARAHSLQICVGLILLAILIGYSDIVASVEPPVITYSFDDVTKTAHIKEDLVEAVTVEQISTSQDLVTMEEVFKITSHKNNLKTSDLGITTHHNKVKGKKEIDQTKTEWFIQTTVPYGVTNNIYGTVENSTLINNIVAADNITTTWNINRTPVQYGSNNGLYKWNFSNGITNFTPDWSVIGFDRHQNLTGDTLPVNTIFYYNEAAIVGTNTTTEYRTEWQPLGKNDIKIDDGQSVILKVIYHKEAEAGIVSIQTIPSFYNTPIPELTWWNNSWQYVVNNAMVNGIRPYQIPLNITNGTGTNNATDVFISCKAVNCSDLRFTLENTTELPYWFEQNTSDSATTLGKVWVNVTGNGTVNMYYGNGAATWASNGTKTFPFFEDFESYAVGSSINNQNGWTVTSQYGGTFSGTIVNTTSVPPGTKSLQAYSSGGGDGAVNVAKTYSAISGDQRFEGNFRTDKPQSGGTCTYSLGAFGVVIAVPGVTNMYMSLGRCIDNTGNLFSFIGSTNHTPYILNTWYNTSGILNYTIGKATTSVNGTQYANVTLNGTNTTQVSISTYTANGAWSEWADNLRIRSYASPELTWSTWGTQIQSDFNPPTLTSSSFNPTSGTGGVLTTLTANFSDNTAVSSAIVSIQTPNQTASNYTMSCTPSGTNATCTLDYTDTDAAGTYTVLKFYPKDNAGNEGSITPSLTYLVLAVVQPVDVVNGVTAILNTSTPSNATMDEFKSNGITTSVITLDWDNISASTWNNMLPAINYSYNIGMRIALRLNVGGDYNNTPNVNRANINITAHFPDLKVDPYESDIQWIEFNFTNSSATAAQRGNFSNKISQNITEQTNNKFPVYTVQTASGLDSVYVKSNPLIYLNIVNDSDFISQESITTRGNTTRSRVYSGATNFTLISLYKTNIINRLRGTIAGTQPAETYATNVNNGSGGYDIILYNNQSSTQNRSISGLTGTYLDTTGDVLKQLPTSGTLYFNVSANSFSYITKEAIDRVVLGTTSHIAYSVPETTNKTFVYGTNQYDNTGLLTANLDIKTELFDPSFIKTPLSIVNYAWLNSSLITNYTDYKYVIIADKNAASINATINQSAANTYIYISVADYANTDAWVAGKKTEADWAIARGYNTFVDGMDSGVGGTNFSARIKELVQYIRVTNNKKVILNTYTAFQDFATFGDVIMKESAFSRWDGTVNAPVYSWEDMDLEKQRASYFNSHNIPVVLMSFGAVDDYDKFYFDYMAGAVLYGYNGNNTFRYGQPNFQNQTEIRVPNIGTMLESGFTVTSTADWNRLYAKGRVHIDPVNHTASIDNNKTVNNISVDLYLYSNSAGSGDRNLTLTVNEPNGTFHNLTYGAETTGVWSWKNIPLSVSDYKEHGHYRIYFATRAGGAGGWSNLGKDNTSKTGTHSWYDTTAVNLNASNDSNYTWSSLGNDIQFMARLNVNYTTATQIDSLAVSRIIQTTTKSGANYTINVTGTAEVNASIYAITQTLLTSSITNIWFKAINGSWISASLPAGNTSDINATKITSWTYTVIDGYLYGVVTSVIDSAHTLVRFLFPHLSSQEAIVGISTPIINSWSNNATNNDSLAPRINLSTAIYFFVTSDQTITTWEWFRDGVNQNNNQSDFTTSWNTLGIKTINMTATNDNGTSPTKTWTVTVSDITDPWLTNETVRATAIAVNESNNISANFTDDTNISSAIIRLQTPDLTYSDYAMTCGATGNTSNCYYVTTNTSAFGTYNVLYYSVVDGSAHRKNITTSNSFLVSDKPHIIDWSNTITSNNSLSGIRLNISTPISFSITTDAIIQYYTWSIDGVPQAGENARTFSTSWDTLGAKNVSVTATNQFGTSLATIWNLTVSDITAPWLTSSSTDSTNSYVQGYAVTVYANLMDDTNITSVKARIVNPDASEANWTMACGISGTTANCNLAYATTMILGNYHITSFYTVDGTGNQRNISSSLSFTIQPPLAGGSTGSSGDTIPISGGGGGGGGGRAGGTPTPVPTPAPATSSTTNKINFTDIREGATEPTAIDVAKCLTDSLTMNNQCSSLNYGVVVEPFNWWVAVGAYLFSLVVIFIQTIRSDKKREWLKETLLYGTLTVILSAILVSVGFNVYIINYLIDSPKYFYTFLNFGAFGTFVALIGDSYFYRNDTKHYTLKKKISILEDLK